MSRARKALIVSEAAVPDVASEVAQALRVLAGAVCQVAAGAHTDNEARQREMAGVFYADCENEFLEVMRKLDPELQRQFEEKVAALCTLKKKGKRK